MHLVVTDDGCGAEDLVKLALESSSGDPRVTIDLVSSGEEAVRVTAGQEVDLVLLDFHLPPGDQEGVKAAELIKKMKPSLPVILVSASPSPAHLKAAQSSGAVACVAKELITSAGVLAVVLRRDWKRLARMAGDQASIWFFRHPGQPAQWGRLGLGHGGRRPSARDARPAGLGEMLFSPAS